MLHVEEYGRLDLVDKVAVDPLIDMVPHEENRLGFARSDPVGTEKA